MKFLICLSLVLAFGSYEAKAEPQWLESPLCRNPNLKEIEDWGRLKAKEKMKGQTKSFTIEEIKYTHSVLRSQNDGFDKYEIVVMFTDRDEYGNETFRFDHIEESISYPSCK